MTGLVEDEDRAVILNIISKKFAQFVEIPLTSKAGNCGNNFK